MQKRKRKPGGGRKPAPYKTTTIAVRVRTEWVNEVKEAIKITVDKLKTETMSNYNPIKGFWVIDKQTNEKKFAVYGANRLGNLRLAVDGKYYSDKQFEKLFKKI